MNVHVKPDVLATERRLPFECVALVLLGGSALGAYQAGMTPEQINPGLAPGLSAAKLLIRPRKPPERMWATVAGMEGQWKYLRRAAAESSSLGGNWRWMLASLGI